MTLQKELEIQTTPSIDKRLSLTPYVHETIERFIAEKETLFQLTNAIGSPLNILFP